MSLMSSAGYTTIPLIVATITDLVVGGWLIDHLIMRGHDETRVRKTVLVTGMLFGLSGWSIPSLIAPKGGTGTIGGIMNFANNLMGVVAPVTTGYIVGLTNSFNGAFFVAGAVLLAGILSYVGTVGPDRANP